MLKHTNKAKQKQRNILYAKLSFFPYTEIFNLTRALRKYHAVIGCELTPVFFTDAHHSDALGFRFPRYLIAGRDGKIIPFNKCQWCNLFSDVDNEELSI